MPIHKVQHFITQDQHSPAGGLEEARQGVGSRCRGLGRRPEGVYPLRASYLPRQVQPGRFPALLRVPGVANEHPNGGLGYVGEPRVVEERRDTIHLGDRRAALRKVIEGSLGMGFAAAELGNEG